MQNPNRLYDKNLRKYLYPPRNEYEKEKEYHKSPKKLSDLSNEYIKKKPNLQLYYHYDDEHLSPSNSSYILNKELNRNALAYTKDENQFSVLDNNYLNNYNSYVPFSYKNKTNYRPERKIYHYSIASKKDYSRDREEDYNLYYYPDQKSRKYYIEKRADPYTQKKYFNKKQEENILPTRVYISDSYNSNKSDLYKFRPSREKDGNKGGIVNLRRKYCTSYEINNIIFIQRWWRNILNKIHKKSENNSNYENDNENEYQYYPSIASRKTYSKGNKRITEKIIPGVNDKFIVQTTRVEVFRNPYINKPLLKPEIITKENKLNNLRNSGSEINKDFDIVLDKDALKRHMINIWNEENMSTSAESFNIIQNESLNTKNYDNIKKIRINDYEEQIKQLKIALSIKEKELIESKNKLKSLPNKKHYENNIQEINYEDYLKKDDISLLGRKKPSDDNLKIQLVDTIFIKNRPTIISYKKPTLFSNKENIIENINNFELIPIEKDPLKKQLVDALYIEGQEIFTNKKEISSSIYKKELMQMNKFSPEKILIEEKVNLEILPIEKEPLKKQLIDNLYIEGIFQTRPENKIQNTYKVSIFKTPKPKNIIEIRENLEIFPVEKEPLKKQLCDALYIEGLILEKSDNKIQNVDKIFIDIQKPKNIMELRDNIQISQIENEPLKMQIADNLYIEKLSLIKPENKIQNIDKITIFKAPIPENIIEVKENLEILPIEKEPLKKQLIDALYIEGLLLNKPENEIQNTNKLSIFRTPKPNNVIEAKDYLTILPKEKEPMQKQLVDDLYIESIKKIKPDNKIQNTDKLTIFKSQKPKNIIEIKDNIELISLEREPLEKQLVDYLYIEKLSLIKPENKIQNVDKLTIFKIQKTPNQIEANENLEILPKRKDPLKKQLTDDLYIEGIKVLPIHKNLIVECNNGLEILANKEKKLLLLKKVEAIRIEGIEKVENEIQHTSLMTILKTPKTPYVIESIEDLFITPKEKEPLKCQIVDDLKIEGNNKIENEIQFIDKIEILKKPKQFLHSIEERDNIEIQPKEKEILKSQIIDNLKIEGNMKEDNKIQIVDKIEIIEALKPVNIIEEKESLFIPPKEKESLKNQIMDNILIEGNIKGDNEIQIVDKMEILKTPKPENIIQLNDNIFISPKEKEDLKIQIIDELKIEENKRPNNEIHTVDKMEILKAPKPKNIIESNSIIFIQKKENEPFEKEIADNILIEGIDRANNEIQRIDILEIIDKSHINEEEIIIEHNDDLFISSKEKEPLKNQIVDKLKNLRILLN